MDTYVLLLLEKLDVCSIAACVGPFDDAGAASDWAQRRAEHWIKWRVVEGNPLPRNAMSVEEGTEFYNLSKPN